METRLRPYILILGASTVETTFRDDDAARKYFEWARKPSRREPLVGIYRLDPGGVRVLIAGTE